MSSGTVQVEKVGSCTGGDRRCQLNARSAAPAPAAQAHAAMCSMRQIILDSIPGESQRGRHSVAHSGSTGWQAMSAASSTPGGRVWAPVTWQGAWATAGCGASG